MTVTPAERHDCGVSTEMRHDRRGPDTATKKREAAKSASRSVHVPSPGEAVEGHFWLELNPGGQGIGTVIRFTQAMTSFE